ncbi:MAG: DUF2069 domain-containing protein [Xanthomonadales bacterium]|nr:DUF2069 domain-containing protein [Xanthomonadales bacterium]MBK7145352.1 DUF2069 domain-containing protein [Xanthomonadales bacterium]MCC6560961.1 DUF2069 domain-containing protein [Xanthomonadales bacterium]
MRRTAGGDTLPLLALCAQALLQIFWHGLLHPPRPLPVALVLGVALLPLLALLPAAWHSRRRALLVGGIVSLLYFSHGVMEYWSNPPLRALASAEIVFALLAIFGLRKTRRPG